jgi:hypothetical protein
MPTTRVLRVKCPPGEDCSLSATFDDQEWAALADFAGEARKMASTRAFAQLRVNIKITAASIGGLKVIGQTPDLDTIALITHRMRPFILQKEPTFFGKVCKILKRRLDSSPIRAMLDLQRAEFFSEAFQAQIRIVVNDAVVNAENTFMDWLNSEEYHRLSDQKARIAALDCVLPNDFLRPLLTSMLLDKMRAVLNVAQFVEAIVLGAGTACDILVPEDDGTMALLPVVARDAL